MKSRVLLQSQLGVEEKAPELIVKLCERTGCDEVLILRHAKPHFDESFFSQRGIRLVAEPYSSPVYPQLWGDFIEDLSSFDLLFNLGPKAFEVVLKEQE